jgi:hypothetical protein
MEEKYNHAIKAGVIGGILFIILSIIDMAVTLSGIMELQIGLGCLLFLLAILVAAGTGALAVRYARPALHTLTDAVVIAAVAGLVAGVIYAVMRMITSMVTAAVARVEVENIMRSWGVPASYGNYGVVQGWAGQCCCAPFAVALVVIVAVIGGALYAALVAKIQ